MSITSPRANELWLPTYAYDITWEAHGACGPFARIELYQDGIFFLMVADETENNGTYAWSIPHPLHTGTPKPDGYTIRITDLQNPYIWAESAGFTIHPNDSIMPWIIVPAAGHAEGAHGTNWKTEMFLRNPADFDADAYLYFNEDMNGNLPPRGIVVHLGPRQTTIMDDVVWQGFGRNGAGSIIVEEVYMPDVLYFFDVSSRTYNDQGEAGTYGQSILGVRVGDRGPFDSHFLMQLKENVEYRTNIGIASAEAVPITVTIGLADENGVSIGSKTITLPPYGFHQENSIYRQFTDRPINGGFAGVSADDPELEYYVYASVVDNRTGDPSYIPEY